jgi:hypothetical protein
MLSNFYKYIRGQSVPSASGAQSCGAACDRVQVGMWYSEASPVYPGYQIFWLDPLDSTYQPILAWAAMLDLPNS